MATMGKSIEIKCRRCGKMAKAEEFTLDYVYKMAVCPSCIKERKTNSSKTLKQSFKEAVETPIEEEPKKVNPPGWDAEDEYLEKLARQKDKAEGITHNPTTPKPYQMSGIEISQPKPNIAKPALQHEQVSKPMSVSEFGMRSSVKPQETNTSLHQTPGAQAPKSQGPMGVSDFGMRASNKAQNEPAQHDSTSVLGQRAKKAESNPDKTKYKCKKCGYDFWYNREKNMPRGCPYCNTLVLHLI